LSAQSASPSDSTSITRRWLASLVPRRLLASIAHKFEPATARVSIFRYDEADLPLPINQDEYDVWLDLERHERLHQMVVQTTTSLDDDFRQFARDNVFLVKRRPGPDHWLSAIPSSITALMKKY
jgi:hypothetical protein